MTSRSASSACARKTLASSSRSRARRATIVAALLAIATVSARASAQVAGTPGLTAPPRNDSAQDDSSDVGAAVPPGEHRRVAGQVLKPGDNGMLTVRGAQVTLHRVGADAAGPLDSLRTGADGKYAFDYVTSGQGGAVYFVSVSYGGIAYLSTPLRQRAVTGPEADVTVFDTTSAPVRLSVRGRHLVVERADTSGLRRVTEVFDLSNDTTLTAVAPAERSGRPTFTAPLPSGARDFQVREGDVSADAVVFAGGEVRVFAPFSPGLKQLAYSYQLADDAFPLRVPLRTATQVLEVLVEDGAATVSGARLAPVAPAALSGHNFRRFLAQDAPADGVVSLSLGGATAAPRNLPLIVAVAVALAAALAGLLALVVRRGRPARAAAAVASTAAPSAEQLARRIADLDARFEAAGSPEEERVSYERDRAALKRELAQLLARRKVPA